jgi:hypothetical protein
MRFGCEMFYFRGGFGVARRVRFLPDHSDFSAFGGQLPMLFGPLLAPLPWVPLAPATLGIGPYRPNFSPPPSPIYAGHFGIGHYGAGPSFSTCPVFSRTVEMFPLPKSGQQLATQAAALPAGADSMLTRGGPSLLPPEVQDAQRPRPQRRRARTHSGFCLAECSHLFPYSRRPASSVSGVHSAPTLIRS